MTKKQNEELAVEDADAQQRLEYLRIIADRCYRTRTLIETPLLMEADGIDADWESAINSSGIKFVATKFRFLAGLLLDVAWECEAEIKRRVEAQPNLAHPEKKKGAAND